jgi:hypothetical protein
LPWLIDVLFTEPPPPPPASSVQMLVAVQEYRLAPAVAIVRKNICPTTHVPGKTEPTFAGDVETAPEKSIFLV